MKLAKFLNAYLLTPLTGYIKDEFYTFVQGGQPVKSISDADVKRPLVLLSKAYYSESHQGYPVEGYRDLVRILNLELKDSDLQTFYLIGDYVNGERIVTFFKLSEEGVAYLDKVGAKLVFPETLVMANSHKGSLVQYQKSQQAYWLYLENNVLYTASAKGVFANAEAVVSSLGLPDSPPVVPVREEHWSPNEALLNLVLSKASFGLLYSPNKESRLNINWLTQCGGAALAVYLTSSFAMNTYLGYRLHDLEGENRTLNRDVTALLDNKQSAEKQIDFINTLNDELQGNRLDFRVWETFYTVLNIPGTSLKKFTATSGGRTNVMGDAETASQVLKGVSELPYTTKASFFADVVEVGNKERFNIVFQVGEETNE